MDTDHLQSVSSDSSVEALKATYHGDINQFAQISMQKEATQR
jgi:hypothetical protein